jgi:hypothetical protein
MAFCTTSARISFLFFKFLTSFCLTIFNIDSAGYSPNWGQQTFSFIIASSAARHKECLVVDKLLFTIMLARNISIVHPIESPSRLLWTQREVWPESWGVHSHSHTILHAITYLLNSEFRKASGLTTCCILAQKA